MKYAIIIDSSAALPEAFVKERSIKILPLNIIINGELTPDYTSEKELLKLYASGRINVKANIDTFPLTPEKMKKYFLEKLCPSTMLQSVSLSLKT